MNAISLGLILNTLAATSALWAQVPIQAQTAEYVEIGRTIVRDAMRQNPDTRYVLDLAPIHDTNKASHATRSAEIADAIGLPSVSAESLLACDLRGDRQTCRLREADLALLRLGDLVINGDKATFDVSVITSAEGDHHAPHPVREGRARAELARDPDGIWRVVRWTPTGIVT